MDRAARATLRPGDHAAADGRAERGKGGVSWPSISGFDADAGRTARARVQLPVRRSGNPGNPSEVKIRPASFAPGHDRREYQNAADHLGSTPGRDRRAGIRWLSRQV